MSIYEIEKRIKGGQSVICPRCGGKWYIKSRHVIECDTCKRHIIKDIGIKITASV